MVQAKANEKIPRNHRGIFFFTRNVSGKGLYTV